MFQSHYLLPSIYVSFTRANKIIFIHIPLFLLLCMCRFVTRRHFSLNALLHTSQVKRRSPLSMCYQTALLPESLITQFTDIMVLTTMCVFYVSSDGSVD